MQKIGITANGKEMFNEVITDDSRILGFILKSFDCTEEQNYGGRN